MQVRTLLLVFASALSLCHSTPVDTYKAQRHRYSTNVDGGPFREQRQKRQKCNYQQLVNCFVSRLEQYTLQLWEQNVNVARVAQKDCQHVKNLGNCIDTAESAYGCNANDVKNTTRQLTELLVHRRGATFLKSYYLLEYACSNEGQNLLNDIGVQQCLLNDQIGESTLAASSYIASQLITESTQHTTYNGKIDHAYKRLGTKPACETVKLRLTSYGKALANVCKMQNGESAANKLLCNSLVRMINGVYKDEVGRDCVLDCNEILKAKAPKPGASSGATSDANGGAQAQAGVQGATGGTTALSPYMLMHLIVLAVLSRWMR